MCWTVKVQLQGQRVKVGLVDVQENRRAVSVMWQGCSELWRRSLESAPGQVDTGWCIVDSGALRPMVGADRRLSVTLTGGCVTSLHWDLIDNWSRNFVSTASDWFSFRQSIRKNLAVVVFFLLGDSKNVWILCVRRSGTHVCWNELWRWNRVFWNVSAGNWDSGGITGKKEYSFRKVAKRVWDEVSKCAGRFGRFKWQSLSLRYFTAQWSLYVPHSGHYMYRQFNIQQFYVLPTQLYLCVLCESENKQRLFPYTTLTDWFL